MMNGAAAAARVHGGLVEPRAGVAEQHRPPPVGPDAEPPAHSRYTASVRARPSSIAALGGFGGRNA